MGNAFLAEGNIEIALAFYDKVVDIWCVKQCKMVDALCAHIAVLTGTDISLV
jgi:hypothetical protein